MPTPEAEFARHERAAWRRWFANVAVIIVATFLANNCQRQIAPLPAPPPQLR